MALNAKKQIYWRRFIQSFRYASRGFICAVKQEQNMKLHVVFAVIVIGMAFVLKVPLTHWLVLIAVIGVVFALELINTALERTVDLVTDEYHPLAEQAKDIAAAAVFVFSIAAVIIGMLIFYEPLISLFAT
ncbi:undecaprenol kinase [Alteribacillus persepolensis]|uniref:Undecaprenol kinase n=1 Tax=Alteribacillus persepolensis TaxID=568899 RepID=A0A1G8CQS4_9BACI|nr:diacylglycerol kinase family protein [Alteribacillus persepolensis]SDH47835.1 undecaprenol kinase [Alteribacillus persepolensis]